MAEQADMDRIVTAAVIIIGNEVLSGRVQDENLGYIASGLKSIGIRLLEGRIIPDVAETIIETVNELRARHDYVFTTGGIGPTHDDITAESVAQAFSVSLELHAQAKRLLESFYGDELNDRRLRMALIPQGAELVGNPVSGAPGFRIENVFVLAGVPRIMRAMFDSLKHSLQGGAPVLSMTVTGYIQESAVADGLAQVEAQFERVEIGSYPFVRDQRFGSALVIRSVDARQLQSATEAVILLVKDLGIDPIVTEGE